MNIPKILETLEKAKASDIPIDVLRLYRPESESFCLVGWLAFEVGVSTDDLHRISTEKFLGTPRYEKFQKRLKDHYGITKEDRGILYGINDTQETPSWEQCIKSIERLKNVHSKNS